MNSMTPIYLSSFGMIGLMVFAAVTNRKSGWRKQRGTELRDVYEMTALWKGLRTTGEGGGGMALPREDDLTIESAASFSRQLVNLQAALSQRERVVAETQTPVESKVLA